MEFSTDPNLKERIYNEFLQEIRGIKFTPREIDTISCIVHNRKEKKIAVILSISPRTVSTHVLNILNKLGFSSRDSIIDFIEKSGKLDYIKQYYSHLIVQNVFEQALVKIAKTVNRNGIHCMLLNKGTGDREPLLAKIVEYLKLANITISNANSRTKYVSNNAPINIHVLLEDPEITAQSSKEEKNIFLLFGKANALVNTNQIAVDFKKEINFYYGVLELIEKITDKPEIVQITKEFKDEYQLLQQSWKGNGKILFNDNIVLHKRIKAKYLFLVFIMVFTLAGASWFSIQREEKMDVAGINQNFAEFTSRFVADNITTEEQKKLNYSLLHNVEKLADHMDNNEIISYFISAKLTDTELLNCLSVLHALANQYTYHKHDGEKARKILLTAKRISEAFLQNKSDLQINVDQLSEEELYTELSMIKDLPEIYTRILLMLGRTHAYSGDLKDSVKYFKQAAYLGGKLAIFEGYMAIRDGLEFVKNIEIENHIRNLEYDKARKKYLNQ